MKKMLILTLVIALCTFSYAQLESVLSQGEFSLNDLPKYKQAMAFDVAKSLGDEATLQFLASKLNARSSSIELVPFLQEMNRVSRGKESLLQSIANLDAAIREIKGIANRLDTILEMRLVFPQRVLDKDVLVAYVPGGSEKSWKTIEAFDLAGNSHKLDPYQLPERQVIVVGLNAHKDMQAGLALMNEELKKAGMQPTAQPSREGGIDVAKLDYIRLEDDQEPWILGDAEIYTLVNGIAPEASKASVIAIEMPYLVTDKKDYYPNQVLIVWQNYRYKAANLNIYEHDDNTNYKELVASLIQAIGQVATEYQMIAEIASKIIRLMPDSWFSNDDDYVDVYYTLEKGKTYTNFQGVSRNAKMTLVPYFIPE